MSAIRILVVDDHDLFRTGLASYLGGESGLEVIAQASGGRAGVRLALELSPDVVLMDLRMPDLDGIAATQAILAQRPDTRVVALTVATENDDIDAALTAGACAFLVKDSPVEHVAAAVRAAATGSAWLSPRAAEAVLRHVRRREPEIDVTTGTPAQTLSVREIDVLRLLAQGLDNAQIADALEISPSTAKNHVSSILTKLGLTSRIQAAVYAVRNDLA